MAHFSPDYPLTFQEITYSYLESFAHTLSIEGVRVNTISNYLRTIRALYRRAIKAKVVDASLYPFQHITIRSEKTVKRAITRENMKAIKELDLIPGSQEYRAKTFFLLSFYLRGASFTDLAYLKSENIRNGRVEYRRQKTKKNYSIKLVDCTDPLLVGQKL